MSKIIDLKINNFRGIKKFSQKFDHNFICLIGRGDSCKTTILEAISCVLSPAWNLSFYDTDFHNCDTNNNIEIETTIIEIPPELQSDSRYGLFIRGYNEETKEISDELEENHKSSLTIKLTVDKNLEPKWVVTTGRAQEDKTISAGDRGKLNCFYVSDYVDRHFSWNKGNPLYSLLKNNSGTLQTDNNIIIEALREAKDKIDSDGFARLQNTMDILVTNAKALGIDITNTKTSIDFKDMAIKDGKICLHDDNVPFRLKGKGSKRLVSIAIQLAITNHSGITLIDELEQGLEPDRIKQLIRSLKDDNKNQIFITTHSRDAIVELVVSDLFLVRKKESNEIIVNDLSYKTDLQGTIRTCPEAFFAKKIIVCEGATEVGICRALDKFRKQNQQEIMTFKDCAYLDGHGSDFFKKTEEMVSFFDKTCVLMDSDDKAANAKKENLKVKGVKIYDWEADLSLEGQVFTDLPWVAINELIDFAIYKHYNNNEPSLNDALNNHVCSLADNWRVCGTDEIRKALAVVSQTKKREWFKRTDRGEFLGDIIFKYYNHVDFIDTRLKTTLDRLNEWIDQ